MPIRRELRHLYRGPAWEQLRRETLERAGHRCERCAKPHHARVFVTRDSTGRWKPLRLGAWRDRSGRPCPAPASGTAYSITVVLTIAHLDHDPRRNEPKNLAALCQSCHLAHDQRQHYAQARRTLAARRGQRWLSPELEYANEPEAIARELARCDHAIEAIENRPDDIGELAWLVTLGVCDLLREKELIRRDGR